MLWAMATPACYVVVSFWMKLWAEPWLDFDVARWFAVCIDCTTKCLLSQSLPALRSIYSNCFYRDRCSMFGLLYWLASLALTVSAVDWPSPFWWLLLRCATLCTR